MRELSRRELYILLIFPGLLILAIYYFAFEDPSQKSLKQLQQQIAVLHRSVDKLDQSIATAEIAPKPQLPAARQEVSQLTAQIKFEEHLVAFNAHPWLMAPTPWTTAAGRIDALHAVASALKEHGLVMISRHVETGSERYIPAELKDFATAVQTDGGHPVPEVWQIQAVGTYRDFLAAVDQLSRRDGFLIPLAVSMTALPDDPARQNWTLWIWI